MSGTGAGSEGLNPLTQPRVDAEPFGLELTAERQCQSIEGLTMTKRRCDTVLDGGGVRVLMGG